MKAKDIAVGGRYVLRWTEDGMNEIADNRDHDGQTVTVMRETEPDECDHGSEAAYWIEADDGWTAIAWDEDLQPQEQARTRCPGCGIPTIKDRDDLTDDEKLCTKCAVDSAPDAS